VTQFGRAKSTLPFLSVVRCQLSVSQRLGARRARSAAEGSDRAGRRGRLDEHYVARRSVRDLPATIASFSERLSKLTADQATTAKTYARDPITIGGWMYPSEDIQLEEFAESS